MFFDHTVTGLDPIPNDVPWYYITLAIVIGAAAINHGTGMIFRSWEREFNLPKWFSAVGDVFGLVLATSIGVLVGHIVWSWVLGGVVALCGAFSHAMVMTFVRARLLGYVNAKNNEENSEKEK